MLMSVKKSANTPPLNVKNSVETKNFIEVFLVGFIYSVYICILKIEGFW